MKKPQKLLVLKQIEEAKNLLLKNSKLKYENEVQKKKKMRQFRILKKNLKKMKKRKEKNKKNKN